MDCPTCNEFRYKRHWSNTQWQSYDPSAGCKVCRGNGTAPEQSAGPASAPVPDRERWRVTLLERYKTYELGPRFKETLYVFLQQEWMGLDSDCRLVLSRLGANTPAGCFTSGHTCNGTRQRLKLWGCRLLS
jgi:hypothetical protein